MLWLSALVDGQQACSTRTHRSSIKVGEGSALQGCGFTGSTSHTSYWDSSGEITYRTSDSNRIHEQLYAEE